MKISVLKHFLPAPLNGILAILSAILLVLAFPDFEFWFLAWFALVPLFFAVEGEKESPVKSLFVGWIFGTCFFFGSCWWLTFAPITYAGFPFLLAYFLLFLATLAVGFFPAIFAALFSILLKRFGVYAILSAPFLWTAIEFLRFWTTGNNWNAIAYSQFNVPFIIQPAKIGGIYLICLLIVLMNAVVFYQLLFLKKTFFDKETTSNYLLTGTVVIQFLIILLPTFSSLLSAKLPFALTEANVIAVQPNVPMSGLNYEKYQQLRQKHVELAENALHKIPKITGDVQTTIVIFPESPMNFMYSEDREFQEFVKNFATKNNVSVLFNAAEPDAKSKAYFNSAVMIDASGEKLAQYDKIYLVPFGESVPAPLKNIMPALVGSFSFGEEYDLLPFGDAKAGVMICFESHFGNHSREYVRQGADVLVEMTNDGYLGETPVLRQHLANAVFRAVETNRPVLRVTNVGITAYINERGEVSDAAESYTEATRVWTVSKSDGSQTFYVKYGDWFAWLCSLASLALLFWSFIKRNNE
jgi:apolipoprotein N-acyltransferase